jgi:hypothetical protein
VARLWELEHTIGLLEARALTGGASEAQWEVKAALQAIDGLHARLKRKGWTVEQRGVWDGLLGARNAAHHKEATVIAMWSYPGEDRLRWRIDDPAKAIKSKAYRLQYVERLEGQPVLPPLREMRDLVKPALS